MIKTIGQNKTWIEENIPCINVTPNQYSALVPAMVYISSYITISFNSMMSQLQQKEPYFNHTRMGPKSLWNLQISGWTYLYFFMYKD